MAINQKDIKKKPHCFAHVLRPSHTKYFEYGTNASLCDAPHINEFELGK